MLESDTYGPLQWAVLSQAIQGESESGDAYLIETAPQTALLAVIDGLGHGPKATLAAQTAIQSLTGQVEQSIEALFQRSHAQLRATRGGVMSLVKLNYQANSLTWLGIGNVNVLLLPGPQSSLSKRKSIWLRGGVVGYNLPTLRPQSEPLAPGDTLLFTTDGIRSRYTTDLPLDFTPETLVQHVFDKHKRGTDDTLVLAVRYTP